MLMRNMTTPMGSGLVGPGKPTVRKAHCPSGRRMAQEAKAGGRKAAGNRESHDRRPPPEDFRITDRIGTGVLA